MDQSEDTESASVAPEVVERLVANHREFLAFLESRVASRAVAEELLQSAFVRTLEKGHTIQDDESAVAWFYRVLRNALTDHYRRDATQRRVNERLTAESVAPATDPELHKAVCTCVNGLLPTLKSEYAGMLERVDLQGDAVSAVAVELGITANNATVRLHRARQALRRQVERTCGACATHGCLDCTCSRSAVV